MMMMVVSRSEPNAVECDAGGFHESQKDPAPSFRFRMLPLSLYTLETSGILLHGTEARSTVCAYQIDYRFNKPVMLIPCTHTSLANDSSQRHLDVLDKAEIIELSRCSSTRGSMVCIVCTHVHTTEHVAKACECLGSYTTLEGLNVRYAVSAFGNKFLNLTLISPPLVMVHSKDIQTCKLLFGRDDVNKVRAIVWQSNQPI